MPSKSHMEKVLREEGWGRDSQESALWWDYLTDKEGYERGLLLQDAYRIAWRRRLSREGRELKAKGWFYNDIWKGWFPPWPSKGFYTREEAIQVERRRK